METDSKPEQCDGVRTSFEERFSKFPYEFLLERYNESAMWPGHYKNYLEQFAWEGYSQGILAMQNAAPPPLSMLQRIPSEITQGMLEILAPVCANPEEVYRKIIEEGKEWSTAYVLQSKWRAR